MREQEKNIMSLAKDQIKVGTGYTLGSRDRLLQRDKEEVDISKPGWELG